MKEVSKELLKIICCPECKSKLRYNKKRSKFKCNKCRKDFEIREGIPILLS
ncbi:MAG: Trm112 family protein [Nanoarchaeota archaeon]|nr:Trm112 family protein [Nanoarchaeota archaeon]